MYNLFKSSGFSITESAKNWRLFGQLFCCHARVDPLLSPKASSSYATFLARDLDAAQSGDEEDHEADLCENLSLINQPSAVAGGSSRKQGGCSKDKRNSAGESRASQDDNLLENKRSSRTFMVKALTNEKNYEKKNKNEPHNNKEASSVAAASASKHNTSGNDSDKSMIDITEDKEEEEIDQLALQRSKSQTDLLTMTKEDAAQVAESLTCQPTKPLINNKPPQPQQVDFLKKVNNALELDGNKTTNSLYDAESDISSSGVSSLGSSQPNSMEFDNAQTSIINVSVKHDDSLLSITDSAKDFTTDVSSTLYKAFFQIATEDELLNVINTCSRPNEILVNLERYVGPVTPFLAITCIHQIYINALNLHPRNSPSYNKLCGEVLTHQRFRSLVALIQENAKNLGNFALLTAASDLLYLRLTLKQSTIPTLLSFVDYETMDLDELRLLASCLHTPNIPMINSEYMYNISASVAVRYIDQIDDLYTLLNIMKCFGRYFTNSVKRQCEAQVVSLSHEFSGLYPDGRSMSAHMLDAFFRMEHAPLKPLLQQASDAIVNGNVPIQPQDISAILRYFVKFGYTLSNHDLLNKLSTTLYSYLPNDHASQFTTNVKWLTVFYHFNSDLLERFVAIVNRDMNDLDFVALSDVLDALAQVYYMPPDADSFFERLHDEMLRKLPTLTTSHVHNAKRKLLLTAFHFAVFGRYPEQLIQLTLNDRQIGRQSPSRYFMKDLCRAVSIERPDLLPRTIPRDLLTDSGPLKLYAFEKDVEQHLSNVIGSSHFGVVVSPVRNMPVFILRATLDGELLRVGRNPGMVPPHMHQTVQNIAIVPLPRSRFCIDSRHAVGKSRFVLRLLRAQGARVVTVPHYDWDQHDSAHKMALLRHKIFQQRADDVVE